MNNSLNLYHIFYEAAKCGNISGAAKVLFISQPAVSKAIQKLEESLGVPLLLRSSRGVRLTEGGELLFSQLDTAFRAISAGEEQLRRNEELGIGKLSIGVSTTLCKYVLLPYLQEFISENPHVKISISCQSTFETLSGLEDGSLDIGLVGESERLSGLEFEPLNQICDVFVATRNYLDNLAKRASYRVPHGGENMAHGQPLMGSKERLTRNDLFSHATLLLLDKNNVTRQYVDKFLQQQNIIMDQQLEVTTMDLLIDFAKIGLGIACVIQQFVEKELGNGSLVLFPTQEPIPPRQIGLAYRKNVPLTPAAGKFLQQMIKKQTVQSR